MSEALNSSRDNIGSDAHAIGNADAGLTLGREIHSRYGIGPGLVRGCSDFGLGNRMSRFAAGRSSLLLGIQERWRGTDSFRSVWPQLDRVWSMSRRVPLLTRAAN